MFGYSTHKLKIRADSKHQLPSEFLRSLFLRSSTLGPGSLSASEEFTIASSSSHKPKPTHKRRSGPRAASIATNPKVQQNVFQRSFSYPTESPRSINPSPSPVLNPPNVDPLHADVQRPSLRPQGVRTDPSPSLARNLSLDALGFPNALVIAGLENVSVPAQRALLQVLSDQTVVLDDQDGDWAWNLPEGFIIVYVCVADPRERPMIHKSLVSAFSEKLCLGRFI